MRKKKMIIIKLEGGLGNQMFQYALANIVAKKNETTILIDNTFFSQTQKKEGFTPRNFELSIFNNTYINASSSDIATFYKPSILEKFKSKLGFNSFKVYYEKQFGFDNNLQSINSPVYLSGYFQSYKYFIGHESFIRKLFAFPFEKLDAVNRKMLLKINNSNSISVHIRRGDYVSDKITQNYHGNCSLSYYEEAISNIASKIDDITFFFFSDDLEWVKKQFKDLSYPKFFIDHNQNNDNWKDMFLMSSCNHNIIANSSFSWWAAWLNANIDKKVIAPKKWFSDAEKNANDLIPVEWIRL